MYHGLQARGTCKECPYFPGAKKTNPLINKRSTVVEQLHSVLELFVNSNFTFKRKTQYRY